MGDSNFWGGMGGGGMQFKPGSEGSPGNIGNIQYNTGPGPQGGMQSGAANNMFPLSNNSNTGPGSLAAQYGWGPAGFGWGGMFGAPSWQGFNQTSVPPGLGGGQPGQGGMNPGLMGGASSGWPWMQMMNPFWQYMQAGGVGGPQPGGAQAPGPSSTPAPGAPSSLASPHFQNVGRATGQAVAPGLQSPQYSIEHLFPQHIQSAGPDAPGSQWKGPLISGNMGVR